MENYKNKFNNIINQKFSEMNNETSNVNVNKDTSSNIDTSSNLKDIKTHRTFMGELSELLFPLCVANYFVTNKASSEDIFNAIEHIKLTREKSFILFDSEVNEVSSLFLSKSEDLKARLLARKQETNKPPKESNIKYFSDIKSDELFKQLNIESQINSIKEEILRHFIPLKDSQDPSQFKFEGTEEINNFKIIYLAHLYRSKQHAIEGQKEHNATRWYKERSNGIVKELDKPELAFADTKIIKGGRGGVSVAIRFILVPLSSLNENVEHKPVAFSMKDSSDSVRVVLNVDYSEAFLNDLVSIIETPNHEKFSEVNKMIETFIENLQNVPEILEARDYLEYLTSNNEIDFIDLNIRSSGSMGAHEGGLIGNIKKDADIKVIEFDSSNRQGVKDSKIFSFSLKASDRKDVGIIQFNDKWKDEMEWVFDICDLEFSKLNWDKFAPQGDSDSIMENMKNYFISIEKSQNEKLVRFMFAMLDLFAHGHEGSSIITISQSKKDIKVYSTLISEYIRSRKIYVSVLDMNIPENISTYYSRFEKRKGEAKRGRKPSLNVKQFLLQLTDDSNDSFGVFKLIQSQSRRSAAKLSEDAGRKAEEISFNPYKIVIDDELDDLCGKLSNDLKDPRRRNLWSINRIFRRISLMEKLIQKNIKNIKLLNQYKEVIESFNSLLKLYSEKSDIHADSIDSNLINRLKNEKTYNLSEFYSGEYESIKDYMFNSGKLDNDKENQLKNFYGTVLVYTRKKCVSILEQIMNLTSQ